jgi:hypothetical protein
MDTLPSLHPAAAPSTGERDWTGWLTAENAPHVARRLERMLPGRTFAMVLMWEYNGWQRPDMRAGCRVDARDRPRTEHGISWSVRDDEFRGEGHHCAMVGFSAGDRSFDFTSLLERQPQTQEEREQPDAVRSCAIRFKHDSIEFSEQTPEGRGARCMLILDEPLTHTLELITLVESHEATTTVPDESVALLFKTAAENARWELKRG